MCSPRVGNPRFGVSASCPVTRWKNGHRGIRLRSSFHYVYEWRVDCHFWPSVRPIEELRHRQWLRYCTLAVSTPSMLSTISGCYLTCVQIKKLRLVALLCARLWRVDCVTRRLCDELTGDELTVWWHDHVTSWLVAFPVRTDGNQV